MGTQSGKCFEDSSRCLQDRCGEGELVETRPAYTPGIDSWEKMGVSASSGCSSRSPVESDFNNPTGKDYQQDASLTFNDGSTYTGSTSVDGKRHGFGTWKSLTGQYTGEWKDDQQDGQGEQRWQDGRIYVGQFQRARFHGHGRMEWHTQGLMIFEGQYVDDQRNGQGKFVWPDGRIYDGEWTDGMRWGQGTYFNTKGQPRKGLWVNDKLDRWLDHKYSFSA